MAISLRTNISALTAERRVANASREVAQTYERLSSGLRINRASDDAAGLAVSSVLNAHSRVFGQAIRNGNDAISALTIAEGGLEQLSNILNRITELASQAANGTLSNAQRGSLDREAQALSAEFARIQETTKFNGISLIDDSSRSLGIQLGIGSSGRLAVGVGIFGTGTTGSNSTTYSYDGYTPGAGLGISDVSAVETGDFDGDGLDDVVSMSFSGDIYFHKNNGSGLDAAIYYGSTAVGPVAGSAMRDLNGDGREEFVIALTDGTIGVADFSGGVQTSLLGTTITSAGLQLADINGDGYMDFVASVGNALITGYNDGLGSVGATQTSAALGSTIQYFTLGNFWGAGLSDVAVKTAGNSVTVYQGLGDGLFNTANVALDGGVGVYSPGDLDGDGIDDLLILKNSSVDVWRCGGGGGFQQIDTIGVSNILQIVTADYNGDGLLDLVGIDAVNTASFLAGQGGASFSFDSSSGSLFYSTAGRIRSGDFNNDGYDDIIGLGVNGPAQDAMGWVSQVSESVTSTLQSVVTLESFSLSTAGSARSAIDIIESARRMLAATKGQVGASMSRIGSALETMFATRLNYEAAASRILDADTAIEAARLVRSQIAQKTAAAVLSQANQEPRLALQLLEFGRR